ncbi:N-acetyl sugar amidotransferase [Motilimonas sp. E26]|uniref:N-acetyl sugar amidotransferase n=1 Tax=Motilimonas sp. E26 TaxID=2865674 RepID=UPI001E3806EC|nr:N-acetyl sugar amidotransferase [Motilimonas sp. E26]MCE0558567.1 N-acetyl sugar amidotransferase [Motilimonas sp. E26]
MKKIFWCKTCLNMSTRPRISFDENGSCNACQWKEEKKDLNWSNRQEELDALLNKYRSSNSKGFDCIVPVSGGKDGSYVAYTLKHKYGMNPLAVTIRPALSLELGDENLSNFIASGFNHIHISPDANVMQKLNKLGFVEKGFPYYGWLIAIKTAVIQTAMNFGIPLIFYGEDGEVEYGGSTESKNKALYDIEYMKRVYFEGGYEKVFNEVLKQPDVNEGDLAFWKFPTDEQVSESELAFTHWSYFEAWDSYRNYVVAKEHCGLKEKEEGTAGTFTNFAQNDQALYSLHAYLMYLKFGFGRATQDAGIEIRRGAMTREQALNLVAAYDNQYPHEFIDLYLDYYKMTKDEFDVVLDKYANKDLFEKVNGIWEPKFTVGEDFEV